jgi:hypothetical protein
MNGVEIEMWIMVLQKWELRDNQVFFMYFELRINFYIWKVKTIASGERNKYKLFKILLSS